LFESVEVERRLQELEEHKSEIEEYRRKGESEMERFAGVQAKSA
jgi:hypothetical protein